VGAELRSRGRQQPQGRLGLPCPPGRTPRPRPSDIPPRGEAENRSSPHPSRVQPSSPRRASRARAAVSRTGARPRSAPRRPAWHDARRRGLTCSRSGAYTRRRDHRERR
jgi:hypothetical protein